jgi:hypothetical protein
MGTFLRLMPKLDLIDTVVMITILTMKENISLVVTDYVFSFIINIITGKRLKLYKNIILRYYLTN